jgi:molybdopterin/thiamine biosynthesis adenylyltransferase
MGIDDDQFDRQKRISDWDQESISKAKVLVVGAGALGNEVIKTLCQIGIENIVLVDYDIVVLANLNRCIFFDESDALEKRLKAEVIAKKAKEQYPKTTIMPVIKKIEDRKSVV